MGRKERASLEVESRKEKKKHKKGKDEANKDDCEEKLTALEVVDKTDKEAVRTMFDNSREGVNEKKKKKREKEGGEMVIEKYDNSGERANKKKKRKREKEEGEMVIEKMINKEECIKDGEKSVEITKDKVDSTGQVKKRKKIIDDTEVDTSTVYEDVAIIPNRGRNKKKKQKEEKKESKEKKEKGEKKGEKEKGEKKGEKEKGEKKGEKEKGEKKGEKRSRSSKSSLHFHKGIGAPDNSEKSAPKKASRRVSFADDVEVFSSSDGPNHEHEDDLEFFSSSDDPRHEHEGLIRGKRFSKEEDKIVEEAVFKYIEDHALGDEGLDMVLHRSHPEAKNHPELKTCWRDIGAALPWRPFTSVYYRAHILFERAEKRKWTPEEYEEIRKFYKEKGADWRTLGDRLGKHRIHVKDAWRRIKLPNLKKGKWSQEEYENLFDLVNKDLRMKVFEEKKTKHGMLRDNICWEAISETLGTRTGSSCDVKWYKQLTSPLVSQNLWSDVDDYRLLDALNSLDACCIEDVDWDDLLEHRPGDICRKRWYQMVKHIGQFALKSFPEQVEVLSKRYLTDLIEAREIYANKTPVD